MNYPHHIEIPMEKVKELSSTNDYLAQLCRDNKAKEFHTVVAESQTQGKGQRGNHWESEAGKNLTFSIVLYPTALEVKKHFCLSMLAALSCIEALGDYADGFAIKWPNDIYWKHYKIWGTLTQHFLQGTLIQHTIVGVGLNVNQCHFTSDAPNPISLRQILGHDVERPELLSAICHTFAHPTELIPTELDAAALHARYTTLLYRLGMPATYRDAQGTFTATLHHVEPDGRLILIDEQGTPRSYLFKEVAYII